MLRKIWLSPPHMCGEEQKYIQNAFETNWIAPVGSNINEFEDGLELYLGEGKQTVALNSGTSAIHLALKLAGVEKGDEVICQSFTYIATVNPVLYLGAKPILVDSERDTWNICPILLKKAIVNRISKGKKPKAILAVHSYGVPYNVNELKKISLEFDIPIVEDAAAALGSRFNNKQCGTFGNYAIISFNGNKIITTSAGGALICNTIIEKKKAIFLASQAKEATSDFSHTELGYNYRMSNVLAGIGRGQLSVLEDRIKSRRENFEYYKNELNDNSDISFLEDLDQVNSNRWLTCILTKSFNQREGIRLGLESKSIESRPLWKPMHQQDFYKKHPSYLNGVSDDLYNRGLCLPSGSNLTKDDLKKIVNSIKELL